MRLPAKMFFALLFVIIFLIIVQNLVGSLVYKDGRRASGALSVLNQDSVLGMLKTLSIKIKGTIPAKASPKADASTDLYCKGDICYMNASKKSQNPSGIIAVDKETLFESCSDGSNKDDELCGELKKSGFEFINGSK